MAIPSATRERVEQLLEKLIDRRVPVNVRDRMRMSFETRGNAITLLGERPLWNEPETWVTNKIAQFRYDPASDRWTLFWSDSRDRWLRYEGKRPDAGVASLIREVDNDPFCVFFG